MIALTRKRPSRATRTPRTLRDSALLVGRVVLWLGIGIVLLRGMEASLKPPAPPVTTASAAPTVTWPDQAANAAAVAYARTYLETAERERVSAEKHDKAATVVEVSAAGHEDIADGRARISVDAVLLDPGKDQSRMIALAVTVARQQDGTTKVEDLPGAAPQTPRTAPESALGVPLSGTGSDEISSVLNRYVAAYLAGDGQALEYLVTPGKHPRAAGGFKIQGDVQVTGELPTERGWLDVSCAATDAVGARFQMQFRALVELVDGRWYVGELV